MPEEQLIISSIQNPKVKFLRSLHKNSVRKSQRLIVVEGFKEVSYALEAGWQLHSLYVCPEVAPPDTFATHSPVLVSRPVFERLAYRAGSDGTIGIFHEVTTTLNDLKFTGTPFLIVVEAVEKPGNLGAIIRTADGAGANAVIVCDPRCDIWNPNAIRASVGTIFHKPVIATSNETLHSYLQEHSISAYAALLADRSEEYTSPDYTAATAIILGTEHEGLSLFWQKHAHPIVIPMHGVNDSLNVSNAAAILAYEVVRQRG